jgi:WD40 repeat protein
MLTPTLLIVVLSGLFPIAEPAPRVDALGEPLPDGAVARLGSRLLTPGELVHSMAFSPGGKRLAVWISPWGGSNPNRLIIADAATGRELRSTNLPCKIVAMRWLSDGRGLAVVKLTKKDFYVWEFTDDKNPLPDRGKFDDAIFDNDPQAVSISPDGRFLALDSRRFDASVRPVELRELVPNTPLDQLRGTELERANGYVMTQFSPDGRHLFVLRRFRKAAGPAPLEPGPADRDLADGARVTVYDVATRKRTHEFQTAGPVMYIAGNDAPRLALSPDGKTLYVADSKGVVHAYDWAAGRETMLFEPHAPVDSRRERPGIISLALSPDGKTAYSIGPSQTVSAVDLTAAKPAARVFDGATQVHQVVASPDGGRLAVTGGTGNSRVTLLDAKTGADLLPRPGDVFAISSIAVRADGTVVTASADRTVCWWDAERGRELRRRQFDAGEFAYVNCELTADGRGIFAAAGGDILFIDLESGLKSVVTAEPIKPLAGLLGVSGSTVFHNTSDGKTRQWAATTGRVRQTYERGGHMSMSPDGWLVVGLGSHYQRSQQFASYNHSEIAFFDPATGKQTRRWQTTEARFEKAAWSGDGRHLLLAGLPMGGGRVKDLEDALPISAVSALLLFDGRTGEPLRAFEPVARTEHGLMMVTAVMFSPDGTFFAIGQIDGSVHLYELATGKPCRSFRGHRNQVSGLAFAAGGRRLISVSHDMTGLVWDTTLAGLAKPAEIDSDAKRGRAWEHLAVPEWELAGPALAALARRPDELAVLVSSRLKPAEKPGIDAEAVAKLIAHLDDPVFAARERAAAALGRLGHDVLPMLHERLAKASAEGRKRLRQLTRDIAASAVPSERLRELRVVALLEQSNTEATRAELKRLSTGHADAALTRDAAAALKRLK